MATSGKYNYKPTRDGLIQEAMELIGVYDPGKTTSAADITSCSNTLRMMLQMMKADDIGLWLNREATLYLQEDTYSYNLGPTGDHCSLNGVKTELAAAAASGAASITIDATTGMSDNFDRNGICTASTPAGAGAMTLNGALVTDSVAYLPSQRKVLIYSSGNDSGVSFTITGKDGDGATVTESITGPNTTTVYSAETYLTVTSISIGGAGTGSIEIGCVGDPVGVELDDGTLHWTFMAGALSTTTPLVTALTGVAAIDNHVYVYDKEIQRPDLLISARRHMTSGNDIPLNVISRDQYERLPNKSTTGTINSVYYDPQRINGVLKIWSSCADVQEYLLLTIRYPLEDMLASTNDFDLPSEWMLPLAWNLAVYIAPKYGKKLSPTFEVRAEAMKETLKGFDRENSSVLLEIE